jgi:hypothetical protein
VVKLEYSLSRVVNAPIMNTFRLEHEIKFNTFKQLGLEVNTHFEGLHLLLDREIALRRMLDQVLDNDDSYDMVQDLNQAHSCEGKVVRSIRGSSNILFQRCTRLCRLTKEARIRLVSLEEQLRMVIARQHKALRDIATLETRLRVDQVGFGSSERQEAQLNTLQGHVDSLLRSHQESFHKRSAFFHNGIRVRGRSDYLPQQNKDKKLRVYKQVSLRQVSKRIVKKERKVLVLNPKKEARTFKEIVEEGRLVQKVLQPIFFPSRRTLDLTPAQYKRLIWLRHYWHRASQEEGQALHTELYEIERRLIQQQHPLPSGCLHVPSSHLDMRIAPFLEQVGKMRAGLSEMNSLLKSLSPQERY